MREKPRLSDLKVLFVCPSKNWGTLERRAVQDATYLRDSGSEPIIFCLKNTPVYEEAKKEDIRIKVYSKQEIKKKFEFSYYRNLKKILGIYKFDLIHCYGLEYIWPLCMLLKKHKRIPLFLTVNKNMSKNYNTFWYKVLFSRIDRVLTFDDLILDFARAMLPIKKKKLDVIGVGIETSLVEQRKDSQSSSWRIGCYIRKTTSDVNLVTPIFNSMRAMLSSQREGDEKIDLVLFTDTTWNQSHINKELRGYIMDMGLENNIRLENKIRPLSDLSMLDIFLGIETGEPFFDYEVNALLHGVPIISPRTSSRATLFGHGRQVGETYKMGDSRELKVKIQKMLTRYSTYSENVKSQKEELESLHCLENYASSLFDLYMKLLEQRERLSKAKG